MTQHPDFTPFTARDLRRTWKTLAGDAGIPKEMRDRLQNHAQRGDVFYVHSGDGVRFSKPMRVNRHPKSAIAMGNIRGAQLAVGKGGRVHVAWMGSDQAEPRVDRDLPWSQVPRS